MNTKQEFENLLSSTLEELGQDLKNTDNTKAAVAIFMAERAEHLATIASEPGFDRAVIAERNSVALLAGLSVSEAASAFDQRLVGLIGGALRIAAIALI